MAGLFVGGPVLPVVEPIVAAGVTVVRGKAMGKFFLIIMAISIAVLLALSAYIISL